MHGSAFSLLLIWFIQLLMSLLGLQVDSLALTSVNRVLFMLPVFYTMS